MPSQTFPSPYLVFTKTCTARVYGVPVDFHGGQTFVSGAVLEILRAQVVPESVTRNDSALQQYDTLAALDAATDGWFWEPAMGGRLWVKVPDGTQHVTVSY